MKPFNKKQEATLIKNGYKFDDNNRNGTVFVKVMDGQIHRAIVQHDGMIRKYKPFVPMNRFEREKYGLNNIELRPVY